MKRKHIFWVGMVFLWAFPVFSFETVRILESTSTGRALILDRGIFEGVKLNDFALFYRKRERPGHFPRYEPILKAEAIKVGDKISLWLAHESISPGGLYKGGDLSMVRLSRHKRKHLKVEQYQTITSSDNPVDIDKKDQEYSFEEVSSPEKTDEKKDVKLGHTSSWKESQVGDISQLSFEQILPPVDKKGVAKSLEAVHFDKMTTQAIDKLNKSKNVNEYFSILKVPPSHQLSGRDLRWSRNFNDQQLQDFFVKAGVVEEVYNRQKKAIHEWKGSEINVRYATGFHLPFINSSDGIFKVNSALGVGYEYHLANIKPLLKRWTVEVEMEGRHSSLVIEKYRFSSSEYFFKAWAYYYFYNTALNIEQYLIYAGMGIQQGMAILSSAPLRNSYDYQISGLPSFRVGGKYKFVGSKAQLFGMNFGAHILLTVAPLSYQSLKRGRYFRGSNVEQISSTLSLGLSVYL